MEFPHILKLIQQIQFDTIYHEHFSYFSLLTVKEIFSSHELTIFDVDEILTHGGSLRIYVKHSENSHNTVNKKLNNILDIEKQFGLNDVSTYLSFEKKVKNVKQHIQKFFVDAKKDGKTIVCYGAAAKGNTLLNYCNIGTDYIDYAVDLSLHKQGLFLPGTHIPIKDPVDVQTTKPDYLIIIPWNLRDEIMEQMSYIRDWGGKFVILIPEVKIYS